MALMAVKQIQKEETFWYIFGPKNWHEKTKRSIE
ncbi:Uncharacterised protein [Corynebacterium renale]|nr:Uncharacterised protein [Corynebacterium renale]STC94629.1 Uncharacterised protein [Corynebacterium renale]